MTRIYEFRKPRKRRNMRRNSPVMYLKGGIAVGVMAFALIALAELRSEETGQFRQGFFAVTSYTTFPSSSVRAVDGDTLAVGDLRIRLEGIASPESGHPVYAAAREHLGRQVRRGETVACRFKRRTDRYGRKIASCWTLLEDGDRLDLQQEMVTAGLARGCLGWGTWRYLRFENARSVSLPFPGYCWPG